MIQYYIPMTSCITIENPSVIPLLVHMRLFCQPAGSSIHLRLTHPEDLNHRANILESTFHTIQGIDFEKSPYYKVTLRLEGKYDGKNLYAILELNLVDPRVGESVTFSPVPFGVNGKPILPNHLRVNELFLPVARIALGEGAKYAVTWSPGSLAKEVHKILGKPQYEFFDENAWFFLGELEKLALMQCVDKKLKMYKRIITAVQFEETFGVKLPNPAAPAKIMKVTLMNSKGMGVDEVNAHFLGEIYESQPGIFTQNVHIPSGQGVACTDQPYMAEYSFRNVRWQVEGVEGALGH